MYSICLSQGYEEVEIKNDKPKYYAINTDGGSSELAVHYAKADAVVESAIGRDTRKRNLKFHQTIILHYSVLVMPKK